MSRLYKMILVRVVKEAYVIIENMEVLMIIIWVEIWMEKAIVMISSMIRTILLESGIKTILNLGKLYCLDLVNDEIEYLKNL